MPFDPNNPYTTISDYGNSIAVSVNPNNGYYISLTMSKSTSTQQVTQSTQVGYKYALNLSSVLTDTSGTETLNTTVNVNLGDPHSTLQNSSGADLTRNADGSYTVDRTALGDLQVYTPNGYGLGTVKAYQVTTDVQGHITKTFVSSDITSLSTIDLATASDTGSSNTDNITDVARPTFNLSGLPSGYSAVLLVDGAQVSATWNAAAATLVPDVALPAGAHNISYRLVDSTGALSSLSASALSVTRTLTVAPPVAIDLNHDGVISYGNVAMDVNGDGQLDHTAWVGAQDGVLVWDKYQDGQVHNNSQYAFAQYATQSHTDAAGNVRAATDLEGLAEAFDSNHDGEFDARDAMFSQFKVWQDANQNGVSDAGEVHTLAEAGISSIHLTSDGVARTPVVGVNEAGHTTATATDGSHVLVADVGFAYTPGTATTATTAQPAEAVVGPVKAANVLSLVDVLPAPDWQAHDITTAHAAYSLNSTTALTEELLYKVAA